MLTHYLLLGVIPTAHYGSLKYKPIMLSLHDTVKDVLIKLDAEH